MVNRILWGLWAFVSALTGLALLVFSESVFSRDIDSDTNTDDSLTEEIIVTGTRIKRRDFFSASPITTIDREDLEFSGQPTMEEYLNQMPQIQPDYGRTSNNPGDGTAKVNLRGLGAGRTLVLLNGRRVAPSGAFTSSAVNVNNLPRALMERVEIITGGASTVYGSDAIAGVVNFITRQDFEGLGVDGSYSVTAEGNAEIYDTNITYGHQLANGRGNITLFASYYNREPLFAGERELTRIVAGIRGEFADNWEMDAWLTYTDASDSALLSNDGSVSRLLQGLLVDPATGQCFDPSGGCVPLDIFGENRLSAEGVDFIRVAPLENTTSRKQTLAAVVVTGAPFDIWTCKTGLQWQPIPSLRFRTMLQRAVRAPNIAELFTEQLVRDSFFVTDFRPDPCSTIIPNYQSTARGRTCCRCVHRRISLRKSWNAREFLAGLAEAKRMAIHFPKTGLRQT